MAESGQNDLTPILHYMTIMVMMMMATPYFLEVAEVHF